MRVRNLCTVALGVAAVACIANGRAYAGDQYQCTIVGEDTNNTTGFTIAKPGSKLIIKPSTNPADNGVLIQLVLKNVDCPTVGNDGGKANKCGSKGAADDAPTRKHVLSIGAHALGADFPNVVATTYRLEKGVAIFEASGKNTISNNQMLGSAGAALQGHSLGIGIVTLRTPGTNEDDPATGCKVPHLTDVNTCSDGQVYGVAGIGVPQ
jgi:hypothetical protein